MKLLDDQKFILQDEDGILEVSENEICCYSCIHLGG